MSPPLRIYDLSWEQLRVVATVEHGEPFATALLAMLRAFMVPSRAVHPEDFDYPPDVLRFVVELHPTKVKPPVPPVDHEDPGECDECGCTLACRSCEP